MVRFYRPSAFGGRETGIDLVFGIHFLARLPAIRDRFDVHLPTAFLPIKSKDRQVSRLISEAIRRIISVPIKHPALVIRQIMFYTGIFLLRSVSLPMGLAEHVAVAALFSFITFRCRVPELSTAPEALGTGFRRPHSSFVFPCLIMVLVVEEQEVGATVTIGGPCSLPSWGSCRNAVSASEVDSDIGRGESSLLLENPPSLREPFSFRWVLMSSLHSG